MSDRLLHAYVEGLDFFQVRVVRDETSHPMCVECGVCCVVPAWRPLTADDLHRLAGELSVDVDTLRARYPDGLPAPCPFLRRDGTRYVCGVYSARPEVCRAFNRCVPMQRRPENAAELIAREQARFEAYFLEVTDA